jgi:serine/threonine-protein kinase
MVGRYELLTPLASGGMAEIWLARQPGLRGFEKLVVIKRMVGALEDDSEHVEMFLAEARLAAGLTHPHIVQIFELGEADGSFFIVMEFVDGETLSTVWKEARKRGFGLSDALACRLVAWAAEGLHYAHTRVDDQGQVQCIVHRDVSPQNLLVTMDGSLKVVDFGIAKIASQATMSGKLKGKLAYMAPEQARSEPVDARADVFSLGVCLFELLARGRLFPSMEELELLKKVMTLEQFPRLSDRRPDIAPDLEAIVAKAMAAKREDRFQSARELQLALEDWLVSASSRTSAADVSEAMKNLFAERIAARKQLIDQARRGELVPTPMGFEAVSTPSSASGKHLPRTNSFERNLRADLHEQGNTTAPHVPDEPDIPIQTATNVLQVPPKAVRPSRTPLIVGGVVLALVLSVGGYLATRPAPTEPEHPTPPPPVQPTTGTLIVEVTPKTAKRTLDGKEVAEGPLHPPPGKHELVVSAPDAHPRSSVWPGHPSPRYRDAPAAAPSAACQSSRQG